MFDFSITECASSGADTVLPWLLGAAGMAGGLSQ